MDRALFLRRFFQVASRIWIFPNFYQSHCLFLFWFLSFPNSKHWRAPRLNPQTFLCIHPLLRRNSSRTTVLNKYQLYVNDSQIYFRPPSLQWTLDLNDHLSLGQLHLAVNMCLKPNMCKTQLKPTALCPPNTPLVSQISVRWCHHSPCYPGQESTDSSSTPLFLSPYIQPSSKSYWLSLQNTF